MFQTKQINKNNRNKEISINFMLQNEKKMI